ncbi:Sulfatase-modifying factor enzyme 1 [Ekhidna lutea]|uniref:Sulfatase-modifying factor enzyme 1 n=1 Tax=Ekhidna lutea TaxID=447679 RepID=A0A239EJ37_EKHLU|nr:SUMF1/EgtB/PvdO family nonheme iron enzyme [Ekhidna lutea]SNS43912.1 Sulfatase-modifying factor enzyme 1 [Ekhidna lutea]
MKHLTTILLLICTSTFATDLKVENTIYYYENGRSYVSMDISWQNAFRLEQNGVKFHDAAWVFFKWVNNERNGYITIHVKQGGHKAVANGQEQVPLTFTPSKDGMGVFISLANPGESDVSARVVIELEPTDFDGINARQQQLIPYAIEMVYIPEGPVTLGAPNTTEHGALYLSDKDGAIKGLYEIKKQDQSIDIGPENNKLYYQAQSGYEGDQQGTIGAEFPRGVAGFYIMKYEPTQGHYVDFLNSLSPEQQAANNLSEVEGYSQNRGTIYQENGMFIAGKPDQPCNYISWDEGIAYADWAGLRPITEFEYTKACRGSKSPIEMEFPWNTAEKTQVRRQLNSTGDLVYLDLDEGDITNENRDLYGVSLFRVHDLAGSLWEKVISIGHEKGRNFQGTHGDGDLTENGSATNIDWPKGNQDSGGFGFRGGGFYGYGREYHDFNPYSPIAFRPYGGWAGGNSHPAYGIRLGRSGE